MNRSTVRHELAKQGSMRILYITTELEPGTARGYRLALARLRHAGLIDDVRIISPMARPPGGAHPMDLEMSSLIKFSPSIVIIEHPREGMVSAKQVQYLQRRVDFRLILDEGDIYDWKIKRPARALRELIPLSDLVATPGGTHQRRLFTRLGASRVEWLPTSFNADDFGRSPIPRERDFDVVLIGNDTRSRLPFRSMPGAPERARLVNLLERRFGDRFVLHGAGWPRGMSEGPLPFLEQEKALQRARLSLNFDHYPDEGRSFSNRLPIAMASGSVHVTSWHPGYEEIFPRHRTSSFLHYSRSPEEIVAQAESLLERYDGKALVKAGEESRNFAFEHLRQDDLLVKMLNWVAENDHAIERCAAMEAWKMDVPTIGEY